MSAGTRVNYASPLNAKYEVKVLTDDKVEQLADLSLEAKALTGHFALRSKSLGRSGLNGKRRAALTEVGGRWS